MTVYGYARVSTSGQARDGNSLEAQQDALIQAGAREIYVDTCSGAQKERPRFREMLSLLGHGDTLVVTKLDRFARSTIDGCTIVRGLLDEGVRVHVLNMGVMENTPVGRMMMAVMFAMAEFEREMIAERTQEGKRIARGREGWREGRPPLDISEAQMLESLDSQREEGLTAAQAAERLGISRSSWYGLRKKYGI